jgi:hypothetical protein
MLTKFHLVKRIKFANYSGIEMEQGWDRNYCKLETYFNHT